MGNEQQQMVPMFAPDGTPINIPYERMHDAMQAGAKMGVNMNAPDGTAIIIPADRTQDAVKAGGKVVPYDFHAPAKESSFYDKLTETDQTTKNPIVRGLSNIGAGAISALGGAASFVAHPVKGIDAIRTSVNDAIDTYVDPKTRPSLGGALSVLPEALELGIGGTAGAEVSGGVTRGAVKGVTSIGDARTALAKRLYTPEGDLTPVAQGLVHPTELPENLLRKVLPDPNEAIRIRNAELEQNATDRMRRGKEQEALDAKAVREKRSAELQARIAARNAPKPDPFAGMTPTDKPIGNAPVPPLQGNPTPFPQNVPGINAPVGEGKPITLKNLILDPNNIPADEVTHQSVPWAELRAKAMSGDKFAIDEVIRRGRENEIPGLASAIGRAKAYPRIGR